MFFISIHHKRASDFSFTVPVAVFILGVAAGLEMMSCRMLLIMSVISFGVLVASYGEIDISWVGVVYQMGGVVAEALRLIFMEILVKRKGLKLNPVSVMYYVSPCRQVIPAFWIFYRKDPYSVPFCSESRKKPHWTKSWFLMQCPLPFHSMDLSREAKDGCSRDMELFTCCAHTQLTLYFCTQPLRFPCDLPY